MVFGKSGSSKHSSCKAIISEADVIKQFDEAEFIHLIEELGGKIDNRENCFDYLNMSEQEK